MFVSSLIIGIYGDSSDDDRPNIIFILVDDLGYSDVGFARGFSSEEVESSDVYYNTFAIDKLAIDDGIILTRHYVHPTCSPTRAAFLTGKYPSVTGFAVGLNGAYSTRALADNQVLLPSVLSQYANYATVFAGKWHVGSRNWQLLPTGFFDEATFTTNGFGYYTHSSEPLYTKYAYMCIYVFFIYSIFVITPFVT